MPQKKETYNRALEHNVFTDGGVALHSASQMSLSQVLQEMRTEEIVELHGECLQALVAEAPPDTALHIYKQAARFLTEVIAYRKRRMADGSIQQVQAVSSKYEDVLQQLDCGIILFDCAGTVSFVNVQMAKFLNVSRKSLLGCSLRQLISHRGLTRTYRKLIYKLFREMYIYRLRFQEVIDDSGRHYLVTTTYGDELDGDILISVKDITEFKRIEQSAYQNDKLALLGKIAASIAHEVRNPLTSIRGFIQLLRPHLKALGKEEYSKIILDEIDRANEIIYEFLNSSKPSTPDKQEIHISALLKEVCLLFESEALLKGCDIELAPIDPQLTVLIDVKQMKQAFLNLVKNSLDAVERSPQKRKGIIRISADKHGSKIRIMLQDNGIGMDHHTMARLFDPFFTTKEEGTGLGLAVCYRIIKNHGGVIGVDSVEGEGTTFFITLPPS
ncbi:ATP-binding protein [Paenibacillus koleovorans]|uniref:ATP-binding protein n=1 Tax=Paenibacillus koleovorans TaxID=121608 RepID=UPI000FD6E60A|nr:ATP-binding protein [Paenibacillus koleovorans]